MQDTTAKVSPTRSVPDATGTPSQKLANEGQRQERLPGVHLAREIGNVLTMKRPSTEQKEEGRLLGLEEFSFLIVLARLPQEMVARLAANPNSVAQHLATGAVYGFRSTAMNRSATAAPAFPGLSRFSGADSVAPQRAGKRKHTGSPAWSLRRP